MTDPVVTAVRALIPSSGSSTEPHWITDSKIASPMSRWPEYRQDRTSWGIAGFGPALVEVETSDGQVGVAPTTGGALVAGIVEGHLQRFVIGRRLNLTSITDCWEQMYRASLPYGRRGLALHAIAAVDLALWDALGHCRALPVHALIGPKRRNELALYATGPRPDVARRLGFVGGKIPLPAGFAEGAAGLAEDLRLAERLRAACGPPEDFFLAYDCYMSLDLEFATELALRLAEMNFRWIEECLPPDEYFDAAELRRRCLGKILVATGEHEATRWGFQLLAELGCADLLQPDLNWCGGLTELLRIGEIAIRHGLQLVPHGSGVYSYHLLATLPEELAPYAEFPMLSPDGLSCTPVFAGLLEGEPMPEGGQVVVPDSPGFGVRKSATTLFTRPVRPSGA